MLPGVYQARKKDGSLYYRSNITFGGKHISLGSFQTEEAAHRAYADADRLLHGTDVTIDNIIFSAYQLSYEKIIVLLNFRDNHMYIKNPIYLFRTYFHYYLTPQEVYKFDIDDLFYFSEHRLLKRGGRLYVNDYGMQVTVLSRYGVRAFAVAGKDYTFANQDAFDLRYANIININPYHGVRRTVKNGIISYDTYIHINGDYHVGTYQTVTDAAIAYNKAVDLAHEHGVRKNFPANFITELSASAYAQAYVRIPLSAKYRKYLRSLQTN